MRRCALFARNPRSRTGREVGYRYRARAVSSVGRAPARQAGGHWFEPSTAHLREALETAPFLLLGHASDAGDFLAVESLGKDEERDSFRAAYRTAFETRNMEIGLFWQRSA